MSIIVNFNRTIQGLVESIIKEHCPGLEGDARQSADTVAHFLSEWYAHLPDYLRLPFKCLVLIFDAWALLGAGRPFHCLPHEQRWRQIQAWKRSACGFRRDLMRFFEMLTVFAWYSEIFVVADATDR
jgi:hypothetical protein